jgi:N-acetylmuramoyl-L-alanine amidase
MSIRGVVHLISTIKQKRQSIWKYFHQHRIASIVAGHVVVMTILALIWLSPSLLGAMAQTPCASGDLTYVVNGGDTLGSIASSHGTTWQGLSNYNHLPNPNLIFIGQHICILQHGSTGVAQTLSGPINSTMAFIRGVSNPYPYGQCTWYASQRYFQLHGVYVPWTTNADAWEWAARAADFHWNISSQPTVGAIMDLQPFVQGAGGLGHVGVVESVLGDGSVIASSQNWGPDYVDVTTFHFYPGAGVSFIVV